MTALDSTAHLPLPGAAVHRPPGRRVRRGLVIALAVVAGVAVLALMLLAAGVAPPVG